MGMVLFQSLAVLLVATIFVPATCQNTPLAVDVTRELVTFNDSLYRAKWPYVDIEVGTPAQPMKALLDINDGDIVVVNTTASNCMNSLTADVICGWGIYDESSSSSAEAQSNGSTVSVSSYGDAALVRDTVSVGSQSFPETNIVVRNVEWPLLGIGGYSNEEGVTPVYSNIPISLYQNQVTNINGYSLYFRHSNSTSPGRLVFGGVETNKFHGALETLQISQAKDSFSYGNITVLLSSMSFSNQGTTTTIDSMDNLQLELAPANPGMALPPAAVRQLLSLLNLTNARRLSDEESDSYSNGIVFPYDTVSNDTTITLQFGSTSIDIPIWDMLLPFNSSHNFIYFANSTDYTYNLPFVGAPFFSNAYCVFDFTHNQLSLAPLNQNALSSDNVTKISSNGVAGLVGTTSQGQGSTTSPTSSPSSGLSTGAKAGIGVGVGVGVPLVIAAVVTFFLLRRRRSKKTSESGVLHNNTYSDGKPTPQLSQYGGEKAELPAGQTQPSHDSYYSPKPDEHQFVPVEMEGDEGSGTAAPGVKRKPVPPAELP